MAAWHEIKNAASLPTPALAVYPERIQRNIRKAIQIAGGGERLRPHVKTHKMSEIVRMHLAEGVSKFKCATIAEAEMAASAGAKDVLIAMQPVGAHLGRVAKLVDSFPRTHFSVICDNMVSAAALAELKCNLGVFVDLNCGMNRTGIASEKAAELYGYIARQRDLRAAGLHAYDGHIHDPDLAKRARECDEAFAAVVKLRQEVGNPNVVAGGTPTFPIHACHSDRELSPGTYVFWDFGYQKFQDLPFEVAAVLVTRIVSKPAANRLCLDIGYKAVASENPHPRIKFFELPEATAVGHNEEHLILETERADDWKVGDLLYGVPRHICPTVALHDECFPVVDGEAQAPWPIEARRRKITI